MVAGTPINLPVPEPRRGGVRGAGRHVRRPHGVRVPARRPGGVLGQRGHGQPGDGARPLPRVAGHHPQGVDQEDGPTRYDGEFYTYRYLNVWPKPYQKPRPKCFIVGTGSEETVKLAVDYDLGYSIVFVPIPNQLRAFARLRQLADEQGKTVEPDDLIVVVIAYVADTDEEAMREARPYIENFLSWYHRVTPRFLSRRDTSRPRSSFGGPRCRAPRRHRGELDDMVDIGRIASARPRRSRTRSRSWCRGGRRQPDQRRSRGRDMPEWMAVEEHDTVRERGDSRIRARVARTVGTAESSPPWG